MAKLAWDAVGERFFEHGTKQGVLFVMDPTDGSYKTGVAWNGLTGISEAPEGAEVTPQYADDIKYLSLVSAEEFKFTIEAFTYPDEFLECDGKAVTTAVPGLTASAQSRTKFGLSYVTTIGNDLNQMFGKKYHIIYGATASPSSADRTTINDSPEAATFSWECSTDAVTSASFEKPSAHYEFDTRKMSEAAIAKLEEILYGTEAAEAGLPTIDEIITQLAAVE